MTGRRLYDIYCDSIAGLSEWERDRMSQTVKLPRSWPFLTRAERTVWIATAKRVPKAR